MRILICGGHGFIGNNITYKLIHQGHDVTVVDNHNHYNETPNWEYNEVLSTRLNYIGTHKFHTIDVTDSTALDAVFEEVKPELVIYLATYPNARMVKRNVVDATHNMVGAVATTLDLCVKYKIKRFVMASSSMVYGDFGETAPVETINCNPLTLYGSYKLQGEQMCKIWHKEYGLEYTLLRPSAIYGERDVIVRAISKMTVSALTTKTIKVIGPTNRLDFTWVEDVADGFITAAFAEEAANETYNCTRGYGRSLIEAAEIIRKRVPADIIVMPADNFYPNRDTLNSDKLKALGWNPTVDIEQGIDRYLDWFLARPKHFFDRLSNP